MTDTSAPNTPSSPAADTPPDAAPVTIAVQYIKDLSFESPRTPHAFAELNRAPQIEVSVGVKVESLGERHYEVILHIEASAKLGDMPLFLVELDYGGVVALSGVPQESINAVLMIECPRLLFPFARAVIANVTRDGGMPPLMINPVDFVAMYRAQIENAAKTAN